MKIEILETGCSCTRSNLAQFAREAAAELGITADVITVDDIKEILRYGVMAPPALVIDGTVKVKGRVPNKVEIKALMKKAANPSP